jgi:O-antigen ligase
LALARKVAFTGSQPPVESPWPARLATLLLTATILYLLIGPNPYDHIAHPDAGTGGVVLSPLNRYAWFVLTGAAIPLIWPKRHEAVEFVWRAWPYLLLLVWFTMTTRWALDPVSSQRRLILLLCQTVICISCCLNLRGGNAMHRAFAASCAIIVLIDLASWILLPGLSQTDIGLAAIHNHKNSLGLAMMFAVFVGVTYLFTLKTWYGRAFWVFILTAAGALLIASLSKTSLGITVAALLITPLILTVMSSRTGVLLSVVTSLLTVLAIAALGWLCLCYLSGRDPLWPLRGLTFTQRTDVWQFVLGQVALRPWKGAGFGSFWDINPMIQPSLKTDYWFAQPDSPTNEAHDGYLDLLAATGIIGLAGALFVIFRWIGHGLSILRTALRSTDASVRAALPYLTFLALFPVLIALHNTMESSYFNTVGLFSFVVILSGIDVDLRYPWQAAPLRPRLPIERRAPALS